MIETITIRPEHRLACLHAKPELREAWVFLFSLDAQCASIVARGHEPLLKQLRLSWWREEVAKPANLRSASAPLLQALTTLEGKSPDLRLADHCLSIIDGWLALFGDDSKTNGGKELWAECRASGIFASYASWVGGNQDECTTAVSLGKAWAIETQDLSVDNAWLSLPNRFKPLNILAAVAEIGRKPKLLQRIWAMLRLQVYVLTGR